MRVGGEEGRVSNFGEGPIPEPAQRRRKRRDTPRLVVEVRVRNETLYQASKRRIVTPPVRGHLAERSASGESPLQVGHLGQQRLLEDGVLGVEKRHASERLERSDHTVDLFAHVFRNEVTRADGVCLH